MIDLDWIKQQGAPTWAQHIAREVHSLQRELFGAEHEPPAAATPAGTPPPPPPAPAMPADEGDDDEGAAAVPGDTGTPLDGFVPPFAVDDPQAK